MKRLVLLGGGHAHLAVLEALAIEPDEHISVSMVTPQPQLIYTGMLPGYVAGHYSLERCAIDLVRGVRRAVQRVATVRALDRRDVGFDILHAAVDCIDLAVTALDRVKAAGFDVPDLFHERSRGSIEIMLELGEHLAKALQVRSCHLVPLQQYTWISFDHVEPQLRVRYCDESREAVHPTYLTEARTDSVVLT